MHLELVGWPQLVDNVLGKAFAQGDVDTQRVGRN